MNYLKHVKNNFIKEKEIVLKGFSIKITPEIKSRMDELYPNEVAIENYVRKLILDKLS